MRGIKKIVGLLNNGEASGDADGEQEVLCLMEDDTLRAAVLPYQKKVAYARDESPFGEDDIWYFNEWSNCYNLILEDRDFMYVKRFNIKNVPVVTVKNLDNLDPLEIHDWDPSKYTIAKIKANEYILIDLSDYK